MLFFLSSLLLMEVLGYYPAVRSLIGGVYAWTGCSAPPHGGITQFSQYLRSPTCEPGLKNLALLTMGSILIQLAPRFTAAEVVTHMSWRRASIAKNVLVLAHRASTDHPRHGLGLCPAAFDRARSTGPLLSSGHLSRPGPVIRAALSSRSC